MTQKAITIKDLAEKLNISVSTVSRALKDNPEISQQTRKTVQALAKELGATHGINRKTCGDVVAEIKKITGGGADYAIDTSGVPDMVKKALASVKFLGTAVVLGVTGDLTINVQEELMGEGKSLIGIVEGDSNPKLFIPQLISYYKEGRFPFDRLIHVYDFNDINEAFHASHSGKVIKALLKMN